VTPPVDGDLILKNTTKKEMKDTSERPYLHLELIDAAVDQDLRSGGVVLVVLVLVVVVVAGDEMREEVHFEDCLQTVGVENLDWSRFGVWIQNGCR